MDRTTRLFDVLLPNEPIALDLSTLYARLHLLADQRDPRGVRYPLPMLLIMALLAKLSGYHHVRAIADWAALRAAELAQVLQFPRATMPHQTTWSRILGTAVDSTALEQVLREVLHAPNTEVPPRVSRWRWTAKRHPKGTRARSRSVTRRASISSPPTCRTRASP